MVEYDQVTWAVLSSVIASGLSAIASIRAMKIHMVYLKKHTDKIDEKMEDNHQDIINLKIALAKYLNDEEIRNKMREIGKRRQPE